MPAFRGRNAIDQAIEANAFLLGCTAHFIDEGMDTGAVIMPVSYTHLLENDGLIDFNDWNMRPLRHKDKVRMGK